MRSRKECVAFAPDQERRCSDATDVAVIVVTKNGVEGLPARAVTGVTVYQLPR